jgi:Ca2+-binding EF-hand superfamily protein
VKNATSTSHNLQYDDISMLMREIHPEYTDDEILEIIRVLALTNSNDVSFDEFKKVFVADIRLSASV